jgi:hypothetical protein
LESRSSKVVGLRVGTVAKLKRERVADTPAR